MLASRVILMHFGNFAPLVRVMGARYPAASMMIALCKGIEIGSSAQQTHETKMRACGIYADPIF